MNKYNIEKWLYKNIAKPIFFQFDAENIHDLFTIVGESLENQKWLLEPFFKYENPNLSKKVLGVKFENSIGLSAGFDYNGHLAKIMKHVGFGFNTVGTATAKPYAGNPYPRLVRLPKSQSILVNKGFKSDGAKKVAERLDKKDLLDHTIGISVGSSNIPAVNTINKAIDDYLETFSIFKSRTYIKYFELNISCPNTALTENFTVKSNFEKLIKATAALNLKQPIFVKMPNEIDPKKSDELVNIGLKYGIQGYIFSNLVKNRNNPGLIKVELAEVITNKGNFSGKPCADNSNRLLRHTRQTFGKDVALIGCGGVFNYQDAIEKFRVGADLVQLITGMIFEGPQVAGDINRQLAK